MSRKFTVESLMNFIRGREEPSLFTYLLQYVKEKSLEKAREYLRKKYAFLEKSLEMYKERIEVIPMDRPKNEKYSNKTTRGRYRFHKGKAVEGTAPEPNLALREANKRKGPRK